LKFRPSLATTKLIQAEWGVSWCRAEDHGIFC